MRFYFSYTIELDEGETAETLAQQCQDMDCPCVDLLDMGERCPLGSIAVSGFCRLENAESWRRVLRQERHEADI